MSISVNVLLLILLILGAPSSSVGQEYKKEKGPPDQPPFEIRIVIKNVQKTAEDPHSITFLVSAILQFVNRGTQPILMYNDENWPWRTGQSLATSGQHSASHRLLFLSTAAPSISGDPKWEEIRRHLDQPSPPADYIRTIDPGEAWEFDQEIVLNIWKKGSFDKTSKPWVEIRQVDDLWLQVTFKMWPHDLEENYLDMQLQKFGKKLQRKWAKTGLLIIEWLDSEPVRIHLPQTEGGVE
jgi:hypothetical protein